MPNSSIKHETSYDKSYDNLRREGNSKQKAARISTAAAVRGTSFVAHKRGQVGTSEDQTVPPLKKRAKELGVSGYSSLPEDKLIAKSRSHRGQSMTVTPFQDLPLADRDRRWDGSAAEKRVRRWAGASDHPNEKYRDAHVWYDGDKKDNFTAYKLLIADVIDGKLTAVPRGVMAATGSVALV